MMSVLSDSYMGMFLPKDLAHRIIHFIDGKIQFPFLKGDELMGIFFVFGKNNGLHTQNDVIEANDLAKRTIASLTNSSRSYNNLSTALDSVFVRHNYVRRIMQLSVEMSNEPSMTYPSAAQRNRRIASDPRVLIDCYAQHIAFFQQDQIFEIFSPLNSEAVPSLLRNKLQSRMILLGYNVKDKDSLPYSSTLTPFLEWLIEFDI